ncbi:MAG: hypothetical protein KBT20_07595 [Bacteroidales bacterium]|nr:hypothetical protein [Candidatus Liminaster caballi]
MEVVYYSIVGMVAFMVHIIINYPYFISKSQNKAVRRYRDYLFVVTLYYMTDIAWGILHETEYLTALYIDTALYYISMAFSVVLCCRNIISFLHIDNIFGKVLDVFGKIFGVTVTIILFVNHFYHNFFWFDDDGTYVAYTWRHVSLITQCMLFGIISLSTLFASIKKVDVERYRYFTIGIFGLCMTAALTAQYLYPLLPLYSIGLMLGSLIVHVFIRLEEDQIQMHRIEALNSKLKEDQQKLQTQKDEISDALGVINGLCQDFHTIWSADKETMSLKLIRMPGVGNIKGTVNLVNQFPNCDVAMQKYIENYVCDEDKERMLAEVNTKTVLERLEKTNFYTVNYMRKKPDGEMDYNQMAFANANTADGKERMVFGFRDINDTFRQQKMLEENIAANKAKTMFLHNMSHEIRTPLNALFGFAQLLGLPDGSCTEEEKAQYNAYIYNSYRMLEMLVSDILDIADSDHGNYRIEIADVNVNSVCRNALMLVEFRVPASVKLYMTSDFDDDFVIQSDERRIQQVLINYLTNACKNTQEGEIHLHCSKSEHPGKVTFSVTDTGRGVPADKAQLIFNRFTKLNQFVQGSGLGLSICQTIASKLDGEVYLDTAYTKGARFVFVI